VAVSRNHCCREKATMRSACIIKPHGTVNNREKIKRRKKILQWRMNVPVSANNETKNGLRKVVHFCPIVTKFGASPHILVKVPNIKFNENPSSGSLVDTCGQTDGRDEASKPFLQLCLCSQEHINFRKLSVL
jgi:hypothetical protein